MKGISFDFFTCFSGFFEVIQFKTRKIRASNAQRSELFCFDFMVLQKIGWILMDSIPEYGTIEIESGHYKLCKSRNNPYFIRFPDPTDLTHTTLTKYVGRRRTSCGGSPWEPSGFNSHRANWTIHLLFSKAKSPIYTYFAYFYGPFSSSQTLSLPESKGNIRSTSSLSSWTHISIGPKDTFIIINQYQAFPHVSNIQQPTKASASTSEDLLYSSPKCGRYL